MCYRYTIPAKLGNVAGALRGFFPAAFSAAKTGPPGAFLAPRPRFCDLVSTPKPALYAAFGVERETGLEPATSALARLRSTK